MVLDAAQEWDGEIPGRGRTRMIVAGAPPPTTTIERVETELGWEFIQIYGLTETAPLLTINRRRAEFDSLTPAERAQKLGRAGVPALGVKLDVDDEGEVLARGNVVLEGYWQQPEETAKAIVDGWFHTGDGGYQEGAYVAITDRKKDVIITGGENVSSIEVEDCLFQHPAVAEVAVIGVPHEKWGETIKALVVLRPGATAIERDLIEHCRTRMAHYKCPTSVELRDELVRTATGKLQKFKLREPYWRGRARRVN
jgi:acyl-CoA synthetase (AMP-forming)/AMP-acid ligase II